MVVVMSGDDPIATSAVLGIASEKAALELAKLRVEIKEIEARLRASRSAAARMKSWAGVLVSVVAIVSGAFGVIRVAGNYFVQQDKELQFQITGELVDLSKQLASADAIERANAALLLSGYQEHAVPLLAATLRRTDKPGLPEQIIESLKLVKANEHVREHPEAVFDPLLAQADLAYRELTVSTNTKKQAALWNYLKAIDELGRGTGNEKILSALERYRRLVEAPNSRVQGDPRSNLLNLIDATRKAVKRAKPGP